jgi:ABC-2 type transport system permease protein
MIALNRIRALIVKELQALLRDRQGRVLLVLPVLLQVAIFPFAATLEVRNNTLALLNEDAGAASSELIQRLSRAEAFTAVIHLGDEAQLREVIDNQRALLALRIPADFSRSIIAGRAASVQAILDGRRSNSGQIALGYVRRIVERFAQEEVAGARASASPPQLAHLVVRHWYNENLDYVHHIIPSLVAIITTISTLVVTSLSVAREREQGTLDQLLVSPLTPGMVMAGKTVPALIVATVQATIVITAGVFIYRIPFQGSVLLLYASMVCYIVSLAGIGLLISSVCSTQQQAFLGTFSFIMPAVLLSGFPSPVENMPAWMQCIDWFNPLRHFIVIVKAVFLKNVGAGMLVQLLWPLLVIAALTLSAADWMFRRRTG